MTATAEAPEQVHPAWKGLGVYSAEELSLEQYHADVVPGGSLSSSGARKLLDPSCPAQFRYDREHPQAPKKEFEIGHAAHKFVLGEGPELAVIDYPDWKKKDAQNQRDDAYAEGKVPLLTKDHDMVQAMAEAIRQHPVAGPLFESGSGVAEQSLYWADPTTGTICRARPDWLKQYPDLMLCVDYKTAAKADPTAVSKAIAERNYHMQDPWYVDGIQAVIGQPARFLFVFQSKTAPYLITVRELSDADRAIGRAKNAHALRTYARCTKDDEWPDWTGPVDQIPYISLPPYVAQREAEEFLNV